MSKEASIEPKLLTPDIPSQILERLAAGKIRELDDITDVCSLMMSGILQKEITTSASREIRQWAELMFTSVQAQSGGDGDVNYITQLIQMNNVETPPMLPEPTPDPQIIEFPTPIQHIEE